MNNIEQRARRLAVMKSRLHPVHQLRDVYQEAHVSNADRHYRLLQSHMDTVEAQQRLQCESLEVIAHVLLSESQASFPPAFDFRGHLARQAAWSEKTFGPGMRTLGICDHIRKELLEIESDPADLCEWIDVMILAFDGAWRCGASPQEIIDALLAKQMKNEARVWPDWRTADPNKAIEHDRSHAAATP